MTALVPDEERGVASVPWKPMALTAVAVVFIAVAIAPDPDAGTLSTYSTEQLISALSNPRETVRQAASGQLIARAKTVVPYLVEAMPSADDRERRALLDVLEELLLSSDPVVAEQAESALERISTEIDRSLADAATRLLAQNAALRHGRAVALFMELGGLVGSTAGESAGLPNTSKNWDYIPFRDIALPLAVLDNRWTGGDQGLRYLARMFPGETLSLHVAKDAPVTDAGIARLRAARERLTVRREWESCLGVIVDARISSQVVAVAGVVEDSPADRAGLRTGDVLLSIEGETIHQFEDLTRHAASHRPGSFVRMTVRRSTRTIRLRLALGTDFRTGRCQCVDAL